MALAYLLVVVALAISGVAAVVAARMKAATVADLASVAAIQSMSCDAANRVARANGMTLVDCRDDGDDVIVEIEAPAPLMLERVSGWLGQGVPRISVSARAGSG